MLEFNDNAWWFVDVSNFKSFGVYIGKTPGWKFWCLCLGNSELEVYDFGTAPSLEIFLFILEKTAGWKCLGLEIL